MENGRTRWAARTATPGGLCAIFIFAAWAGGCGGTPSLPVAGASDTDCVTARVDSEPEFLSAEEAESYFQQVAEEAHGAVIRHEHALRSLRTDKRWDEPDQRIWLAIATTDTLAAIEENRLNERKAHQRLLLLAQR